MSTVDVPRRPTWDEYFLEIARVVATRSHDSETKVGAVIVNSSNHIVSTGYNGFPPHVNDTLWPTTRPEKYPYMVHAEQNAIAHCQTSLIGCTIYVTITPCRDCAKLIATSGISRVVFGEAYRNSDYESTIQFLEDCGIDVCNLSELGQCNQTLKIGDLVDGDIVYKVDNEFAYLVAPSLKRLKTNWYEAGDKCKENGYELPTIEETQLIYRFHKEIDVADNSDGELTLTYFASRNYYVWSSMKAGNNSAWVLRFNDGSLGYANNLNYKFVVPVRKILRVK